MTPSLRRAALRELLRTADLDALVVTNLVNVSYLTGFTGSKATLVVHAGDSVDVEYRTKFFTDGRYTDQAAAEVPDLPRTIYRTDTKALFEAALKDGVRRLGFESDHLTVESYDRLCELAGGLELRGVAGLVQRLRAVKDDTEIGLLREACAIADAALAELIETGVLRAGRTEREIAVELEYLMRRHGADNVAFDSIVAAGANSAIPHHRPTDAVLTLGDFVKLDFGAVRDGYHSDITRTFVLGEPADWQKEIYGLVAAAQAAGRGACVVDAELLGVDRAARTVITEAGYGKQFTHGLGHGVGLEIHEMPALFATAPGRLEAGMTVTVEPGVYLAGRGGCTH
jgi:Xaa-Pro aminopeptidase